LVSSMYKLRSKYRGKLKVFLKEKTARGRSGTRQSVTYTRDGTVNKAKAPVTTVTRIETHEVVLVATPVI
jgi:hypothetical protein